MTDTLNAIAADIGPDRVIDAGDVAGRALDPMGLAAPATPLIRPRSADELARVMRLCHAAGQKVIVLGGATGLAGGLSPAGDEWFVSLEAMRDIEIDAANRVATVGAGVVLQDLHDRAAVAGLSFPLDLGARGTATIGGLIATNAGGEKALRFGMMREQVLGLEVVLADGRRLDLMNAMIKNNTGYDLKQLFIGAEGMLGVVTRAVLRLRPPLPRRHTGFAALPDFDTVLKMKAAVEEALGNDLTAFEIIWPDLYEIVAAASDGPLPLEAGAGYYVLFEAETGLAGDEEAFIDSLAPLIEAELVDDLVLAKSEFERAAMWALRNDVHAMIEAFTPPAAYDVSVPLVEMERFVSTVKTRVTRRWPEARMTAFGHMGDNNLHLVVTLGEETASGKDELNHLVYGEVSRLGGSISAEHGLGAHKRAYLSYSRTPEAIETMRAVKDLFDPTGILQPGKLLPDPV